MPVDDHHAIERATALRLRQKSRSHIWQVLICFFLAAGAAGAYVYQDAKTMSAAPPPQAVVQQPVRPISPPPAPALNKDQTKISTGTGTESEPARPTVAVPQSAARQIEVGQRPVPPPPPTAGNDEEPITLTTAPLPIPRAP